MALALIASPRDLDPVLSLTVLGRRGFERQLATVADQARALACARRPDVMLVDVYLEGVVDLVRGLRGDPATRDLSIVVLTGRTTDPREVPLLKAGVDAVLRLPAGRSFDERLMRHVRVPPRKAARFPASFRPGPESEAVPASGLNISVHGLLLETWAALGTGAEIEVAFRLAGEEDALLLRARGRVVRQGAPRQFGVEFVDLELDVRLAIEEFVLG